MNNPKNQNLKINKKSSKQNHYLQRKKIQKKSSIENLNNLFSFPNNKDLYQTIVIKKTSSKFHSKPKKSEKKPSCCIKSGKTFKSASKFKYQKDKDCKGTLYDLLSLSSSGESLNNKNRKKTKEMKELAYNTINSVNRRLRIFNNKNSNYPKNDNKIKFKSIETTSSNFRRNHCKTNSKKSKADKNSNNKKNKINLKESENNNIIINVFNATISKDNREYYINNFPSSNYNNMNIMNGINNNASKEKHSKKNIQIFNHWNNMNNYNNFINNNNINKDYKNIFPIHSNNKNCNNNINMNNINNYNEIVNQSNQNKTKKRCNTLENLMPFSSNNNNNNIYNSQSKINSGSVPKNNSVNKDSKEKYYHNYNKIKEKNKYIKNKKHQNLTTQIKIIEDMLIKVEDKKNRLKNIFQKSKKNTNLNTINKSLNKNANNMNIVNIKHDYFAHSNTINNESSNKSKHKTYNFLSKVYLNFDQRSRDGHNKGNKIKKNQKFLSFHKYNKNDLKDNMSSNIVKSIDIEDNKNRAPKFNHEITRIFPVDYKSNFFNFNSNSKNTINRVFMNNKKPQSKKDKNLITINNNNDCMNILSNRVTHFNISNTKYNKKRASSNNRKTIEVQKRKKINNAIKIKTSQTSTDNNIKNIKISKIEETIVINDNNNEKRSTSKKEKKEKIKTAKNNSAQQIENIQTIKNIKNNNYIRKFLDENEIKNKDPQYVQEYIEEIVCNLFLEEKIYLKKMGFEMSNDFLQNYGINPETRTCLIDSLIDLQKIFNFNERTLFITVQLFDRYITTSIVNNLSKIEEEDLDIILTTSLLIASKIEESILYKLTDYLGILSDKYTTNNIIEMEDKILKVINFNVVVPTMLDFFEFFAEKCGLNSIQRNKGLFYLNTILLDANLSLIASSAIALSIINIVMGRDCSFILKKINKIFENKKGETIETLFLLNDKERINELCEFIKLFTETINKSEYNHVYKKFNSEKYDFVSKCIGDLDKKSNDNSLIS